ncbi:ATP-binding cassette domain-containing protein [Salipaludibacillus agaradhaerens]|nr:ATP-binding cassette domain-containing protein [Salipaludibacillus agaradhaerens]MCR6117917.1 ATP-binding cassette domain-containing protein [Salipaludibacillus agaradhaerens]
MKQRLGIARAMAHQAKLLLLDEPTNRLDPHGIEKVTSAAHSMKY